MFLEKRKKETCIYVIKINELKAHIKVDASKSELRENNNCIFVESNYTSNKERGDMNENKQRDVERVTKINIDNYINDKMIIEEVTKGVIPTDEDMMIVSICVQ